LHKAESMGCSLPEKKKERKKKLSAKIIFTTSALDFKGNVYSSNFPA